MPKGEHLRRVRQFTTAQDYLTTLSGVTAECQDLLEEEKTKNSLRT